MLVAVFLFAAALGDAIPPPVEYLPAEPKPGDPLLVKVRNCGGEARGKAFEREALSWKAGSGCRAVVPIPVETTPGAHTLVVGGATFDVVVAPPVWRDRELTIAKKFTKTDPAIERRKEEDQKAYDRAFARAFRPPRVTGPFAPPRDAPITAPFGDRRLFNGHMESQHYGTDYDGRIGSPIKAAHDGLVVMTRDNFMSGQTVVLDHGADVFTLYFHMSKMLVRKGQIVKRGQLLGKVGKTGRVTGPHLHFGVRVGGLYVDPETMLKLDVTGP